MGDLQLRILVLGMIQTNCYIASNESTKEAIVFDPADNADRIMKYLKANDLVCKAILLTHGHFDHIMAAQELRTLTHAQIYSHEAEKELLGDPVLNASYEIRKECSLVPDVLLKDGELLKLAGFNIRVLHTPGHTAGGACYYFAGHLVLFSGDTLFREDIGRADKPTGDLRKLIDSIQNKLMILEDQVIVYPGHGEATTIGYERENNFYLTHNPQEFGLI